jgi:hypothetical protein
VIKNALGEVIGVEATFNPELWRNFLHIPRFGGCAALF